MIETVIKDGRAGLSLINGTVKTGQGLQEEDDVTGNVQSHLKTAVQSHASKAGAR